MNKKENRIISLDVLRILAMIGIIGLHLIGNGGILNNLNMHSIRTYIILIIYVVCYLSVDTFAILSGFLSWDKEKVKYKRIIELIFICIFYSIIITAIFYGFNLYNFRHLGKRIIIHSLFPALIGRNWYITSYIFLFFLIPYLNYFIKRISREKFKKLLIILFVLLSIIPNMFYLTDFFKSGDGYSPLWLIYCYLIGAYFGKYLKDKKISKKMIFSLFSCLSLAFVLNCFVRVITPRIYGIRMYESWFISYTSPFIIIASIIVILICSKDIIHIKNQSITKLIYYLSLCSFSVYIIHSHNLIYDLVLKDIMVDYTYSSTLVLIVSLFIGLILVYLICFIIDLIRMGIFRLFKINNLIDKIGNRLNIILD